MKPEADSPQRRAAAPHRVALKRSLSLPLLVLYGLGTTVGAGIYALIGEIAAVAGYLAPVAFLLASVMAGVTALSFAELSARMPRAAGEALYVRRAFGSRALSTLTGLLVVLAGVVSAAALLNGFVGYLQQFVDLERLPAILMIGLALGAAAAWGISESVWIASLFTVIEVGGLLWVVAVSSPAIAQFSDWSRMLPAHGADLTHISGAALLAFYAFIGFEDMVNVAEEVRDVRRNLPLGIVLTLVVTTLLYIVLMVAALTVVTPEELASSSAPLALLYEYATGRPATAVGLIGMFAIINGALIQMVMGARVLYGLSAMAQLPAALSVVSDRTRTPLLATGIVVLAVLTLASLGNLAQLAEATSVTMLIVFAAVNLALWRIKRRRRQPPGLRVLPQWLPLTGFAICCLTVVLKLVGRLVQ